MNRRKFNLGDILRKINESEDASQRQQPPSEPERVPPATHRLSSAGQIKDASPLSQKEEVTHLPEQPLIGKRERSRFESSSSEQKKNSDTHSVRLKPSFKTTESTAEQTSSSFSDRNFHEKTTPLPEKQIPAGVPLPSASLQTMADDNEEEAAFDVFRIMGVLLRRKYIIAIVMAIATLFSVFRYLRSDTYYVANARLLFRPDEQEIINDRRMFRYWGDREKIFATHLELLKSQSVLSIVAQNIGSDINPGTIRAGLTIRQGETEGEKNDIVELSYRHNNAEMARDILNELCKSYIDYRRNINAQEITRLIGKFEYQINKIQKELTAKESALREFKEQNRMVELSNETNVTISKLADMERALQETQLAHLENKERLTALNKQINKQELNIVQSVTYQDPFQNRIAELELELNTLTSEYSSEHYKVKILRQQIESLKAATADSITREAASKTLVKNPIRQMLLQDLVNLTVEKSALDAKRMAQEQLIERLNRELIRLPAMEQQFAYLQRETESLLQTLRMLKGKYEEVKIKKDSEESDLKLLEMARTPTFAISSMKMKTVIINILIGLILGVALAFLLEYFDQSLKEPSAVEKELGLPLLGIVPFIEADNALLEKVTDLTKNILEPFRALRANLKHIAGTHNLKTFIICSAVKGEGKTTLAANLGITFALDGKRVILVDGDLRRSQAHALFAIPKETGLADYLLGTVTIEEIIKPTRFDNMFVITSGERPHNPAELLGTIKFDMLIEEVKAKADIVIFDSPALLPVSDTITMAPKIDGVLFVVRTFWTPLKAAQQALNQLQRINSQLFGGILNGASHSGNYYPYYYGYYGYYSYKYSYDDDHKKPFSVRSTGLKIERSIKEKLTSARFSVPKYALFINRGLRRLAGKKIFWLLFLILVVITGIRLVVQAYGPDIINEPIVYLGFGGNETEGTDAEGSPSIGGDIAFTGQDGDNGRKNQSIIKEDSKQMLHTNKALSDSIRMWFNAFKLKEINIYLSYYDPNSFRFEGGGFPQWKEYTQNRFNQPSDNQSMALDTIQYLKSDKSSVKVMVGYRVNSPSDTIKYNIIMTWIEGSDRWCIIDEKNFVASTQMLKRE